MQLMMVVHQEDSDNGRFDRGLIPRPTARLSPPSAHDVALHLEQFPVKRVGVLARIPLEVLAQELHSRLARAAREHNGNDQHNPPYYCASQECPGLPWAPSGTMPHGCGRHGTEPRDTCAVEQLVDLIAPDDDSDETVRADLVALGVDVEASRERFVAHLDRVEEGVAARSAVRSDDGT